MARTKGSKNHNQEEIKTKIMEHTGEGLSHSDIAQKLEVSKSTVDRYYGILLREGKIARKRSTPAMKLNSMVSVLKENLPGYTDDNYTNVAKELYGQFKVYASKE